MVEPTSLKVNIEFVRGQMTRLCDRRAKIDAAETLYWVEPDDSEPVEITQNLRAMYTNMISI